MIIVLWIVAILLLAIERGKERPPGARSPYKAVAASLFLPGLGQLYNGEARKALMVWASGVVLVLMALLLGLLYQFWGWVALIVIGLALWGGAIVDAIRTANSLQTYTSKTINRWYVYIGAIIVASIVAVPVKNSIGLRAFKIPTEAMLPTLHVGDFILARLETPDSYANKRGDVLVFRYPGDNKTMYIKRVVAFSGEVIEIRDGSLLIDGRSVADPWARTIEQSIDDRVTDFGPYTVPEGTLFVLGDNLASSVDSRIRGALPRDNIVGVAEFIYFSWDPRRNGVQLNRIGMAVEGGK